MSLRRGLPLVVLAIGLFLAQVAHAGHPIQPADGSIVETAKPSFLVHLGPTDTLGLVEVSGPSGRIGSCYARTPTGEPNTYSCEIFQELEGGAYTWSLSFRETKDCETVTLSNGSLFESCSYQDVLVGPFTFTVRLPVLPVDTGLPTIAGPSSRSRIEPRYSGIASKLAGQKATVQCWNHADWNTLHLAWRKYDSEGNGLASVFGYVRMDEPTVINLSPDVCARLDLVSYEKKLPTTRKTKLVVGDAITTLAHEAMHVGGIGDEATAECMAMQLTEETSRRLGAGWRFGRGVAELLWRDQWPKLRGSDYYYTRDCHNGGPLDLYPKDPAWP